MSNNMEEEQGVNLSCKGGDGVSMCHVLRKVTGMQLLLLLRLLCIAVMGQLLTDHSCMTCCSSARQL
jgi:hypothetical protein